MSGPKTIRLTLMHKDRPRQSEWPDDFAEIAVWSDQGFGPCGWGLGVPRYVFSGSARLAPWGRGRPQAG
jgi:hypothetical protein